MAKKARPQTTAGPGRSHLQLTLLLAVLAAGLFLRTANLADTSDSPFYTRPVIDGQTYDNWAKAIVADKAPHEPFYQDPLYPYFLAGIYKLFGHDFTAVYVIQLLLGVLLILLAFDTTRRLFDWRAGIIAAAIAALYKPFIFYENQIEKTSLAVFLTALFLWLLVRSLAPARPTPIGNRKSAIENLMWPLAAGLALGLSALTRANMLLFAPLLPVVLLLNRPSPISGRQSPLVTRHSSLVPALLGLLGVLVVIAPVSIRNSALAHEFTLTTTQAGQNLYIGNSPYNLTGQYDEPPWVRPNPEFEQTDFADYANSVSKSLPPGPRPLPLSYAAVSRFYVRAALDWARTHPAAFSKLLWRKTVLYFNNFEVPDNQDMYFFSRYSWVLRLPLLSFGILFALGLAGVILLCRGLGRWLFAVFFFGYAASVIVFFVFSRYRIPGLPALLPFAGAIPVWLADRVRSRPLSLVRRPSSIVHSPSSPARLVGGLALIAATFALTMYPVCHGSGESLAAQGLSNLAVMYDHEGDTTKAIATYEEALATQPGQGEASRSLGLIMLAQGKLDRAYQLLSDATRAEPDNPVAHHCLGRLYAMQNQTKDAYAEFAKAVSLAPGRVEYRFELATVLQQMQNYGPALAQYDTMIQLAPDNPVVRHNYAVALYNTGHIPEARVQLEEARRLGGPVNPRFDSLLKTGTKPGR
jgi:Tfp pilus assembly protein PilF